MFSLYNSESLEYVSIKFEVDFEAILKLQRKVSDYAKKRIQNVLPLYVFDDFHAECKELRHEIQARRINQKAPLTCTVTMKDEKDKRISETGAVLDYNEVSNLFIVEMYNTRYFMHRLCMQF